LFEKSDASNVKEWFPEVSCIVSSVRIWGSISSNDVPFSVKVTLRVPVVAAVLKLKSIVIILLTFELLTGELMVTCPQTEICIKTINTICVITLIIFIISLSYNYCSKRNKPASVLITCIIVP
jgi:hypothetical protein